MNTPKPPKPSECIVNDTPGDLETLANDLNRKVRGDKITYLGNDIRYIVETDSYTIGDETYETIEEVIKFLEL